MSEIIANLFTAEFFFTVLRVTTPLLLAALASIVSNRAGVTNIALEGIMLTAALCGVIGSGFSQSLLVGLLSAILGGVAMAAVLAYFSLYLETDIILAGISLNMLAIGGTVFVLSVVSGDKGVSTKIPSLVFPKVDIPIIQNIPILGDILSGHSVLTYVAFISVILVWVLLYKTAFGLRLRSVGENPNAASSVGINVKRVQFTALILSGVLASLGGAFMSMGYLSNFTKNMISGRGYIAMAAEAMGQSTPFGTLISSLLFGTAESISYQMQSLAIPAEIVRTIPYIATIVGLVIYAQVNQRNQLKHKQKLEKQIEKNITSNN